MRLIIFSAYFRNKLLFSNNHSHNLFKNCVYLKKTSLSGTRKCFSTTYVLNENVGKVLKSVKLDLILSKYDLHEDPHIINLMKDKTIIEENLKQLEVIKHSEECAKDGKGMLELIEEETRQYEEKLLEIYEKIATHLVPTEEFEDCNDIVVEITAGVGGMEAMLFAGDIKKMYCGFMQYKGWECFVAENDGSELGGVRHCSLLVSGPGVYSVLRHEAGVHRVQRVPSTERGGRMHTSTVTVAVLPQPSDVEVNLSESDLRIETKRASGAGGQHVNTTDSAVRITHIPTGFVVECQAGRSQIHNKALAIKRLQAKLYENQLNKINSDIQHQRKSQVGTSSRSEKIRTYNFRDDRVSDHRLTVNIHNLKAFLEGGDRLDELLRELECRHHRQRLTDIIHSLPKT